MVPLILLSTVGRAKSLLSLNPISAAGVKVCLADKVRLLGVTLDAIVSLNTHVKNVYRAAFYHTSALRHIRSSLTEEMANWVACSLEHSRLDYANALKRRFDVRRLRRTTSGAEYNSQSRDPISNEGSHHADLKTVALATDPSKGHV